MEKTISIMLFIHVVAATGALISGALAIILKRNTPKHKPVGKFYFWCMTIVFITATFISVVKRHQFLFLIGIFTYYSTVIAYRALKLKNLHNGQKPHFIDWLIEAIAGITFLGMVAFAVIVYFQTKSFEAIIPFVFGVLGTYGVYRNILKYIHGQTETMYWLKKHIGNMCGSYIGAITAFTVNQSDHIPLNPIILWLGPTFIITPIIIIELKKIKTQPL
ncbi:MAG: hypothetical protein IPL10_05070 [Bacteroidetes bacterium]|nr:hypothetical protein [Bacteroidota bacterium]